MINKVSVMKQLGLFADTGARATLDFEADRRLAARLSPRILLGPSSWTFAGWEGLVYPPGMRQAELVDRGLEHVARHPLFRTVGIDRSYYAPIAEAELRRYASQLPPGFPCVIKAWSAATTLVDPKGGLNPHFLSPDLVERHVLLPLARAFAPHVGAVVFQFAPMPSRDRPAPERFAEMLDRFFVSLPTAFSYAVEIRNKELLSPAYLAALARHRVGHVIGLWERMPSLGEQLALEGIFTAPFVLSRLSIPPGYRYEDRRRQFAPFDKLVAPDEATRADVVRLARAATALSRTLFITVNNKVEGSSPLTIRALAERIVGQ